MSSLKNVIHRRIHKERSQPESRKKFGFLQKHKDYVLRARDFHKKEETIRKLKEKAAFKNPDEFYFKMVNTRTVDGVHKPANRANKYSAEELLMMRTQDMGYVLQKSQSEKKKIERLSSTLHYLGNRPASKHIYFADDREEAKEIRSHLSGKEASPHSRSADMPEIIKKTAASYEELEARKKRVNTLERMYMDMALQTELQKKGRKRKLRDDELVCPTDRPVYKWRKERKR
ncbi:probable U3 small nucleolar RNA-associated protein 11 [Nymphaea colorata]|nr:probable U3 small nucleolar RNA-associated protein 11 [Nymphaea colorata]XP_031490983.1 probable U3 small nucleolar RNA-associated protein 11 [Nymphaea colorata]XP_031490985.1 probable U3 small nucleolar RNA-associated protein 11 [Nymphaea colorata]XP_031490986.1 probable U3 small nucleolar RNA-associated protein 11 [Nymphaea colorata]XP_031490987.1 probable U3 small nucleolar RNA-associated protein 11 [Nymphaea colorata]XP_031490988.1 probable U3 small nucleolar RNA-associated protein 11 [